MVALPTDETVLNDKYYKLRGFKLGGHVAVVSVALGLLLVTADRCWPACTQQARNLYAEYVSVPWLKVYPTPASIPLDIAAGTLSHGSSLIKDIDI